MKQINWILIIIFSPTLPFQDLFTKFLRKKLNKFRRFAQIVRFYILFRHQIAQFRDQISKKFLFEVCTVMRLNLKNSQMFRSQLWIKVKIPLNG